MNQQINICNPLEIEKNKNIMINQTFDNFFDKYIMYLFSLYIINVKKIIKSLCELLVLNYMLTVPKSEEPSLGTNVR